MANKLQIRLAKDAGFCFGVRDAIQKAEEAAKQYGQVYMLGDIVHNERVISDLSAKNIKVVDSLDKVLDGPLLFRAHGTIPETWDKAREKGIEIIDATCPLVHEIHTEIKRLHDDGRRLFIIGDKGHDEVVAIQAQVPKATVISTPEEARAIPRLKKGGIVSQSTQMIENVQEIIGILMMKIFDLRFVNTVCFPTRRNQEQVKDLAKNSDVMIIVGSFTSANTKRLFAVSKNINPQSYMVASADAIQLEWFAGAKSVGISAGASSPDDLITEVVDYIRKIEV